MPWKIGETMTMVPLRGNGIRSTSSAVANGDTLARGAPFGKPVVPLVRMTEPPGLLGAGSGSVEFAAMMSSIVGTPVGQVGALVHPGEHPRQVGGQRVEQVRELTVVQHRLHVLPLAYLRELRLGESGIHQHQPGAELAARGHRDDEAAMVAAEQAHDRARVDAEPLSAHAPTRVDMSSTCR